MCHCQFNCAFAIWSLLNITTNTASVSDVLSTSRMLYQPPPPSPQPPTSSRNSYDNVSGWNYQTNIRWTSCNSHSSLSYPKFDPFAFMNRNYCIHIAKLSMNFDLNAQILCSMNQIIRLISNQTSNYLWCFLLIPNKLFFYFFGLFRITTVLHAMGSS